MWPSYPQDPLEQLAKVQVFSNEEQAACARYLPSVRTWIAGPSSNDTVLISAIESAFGETIPTGQR